MGMEERDEFLHVMKESVDKWMEAKPEVNIFGNKISTNPNYISILYKERDDTTWTFSNGVEDMVGIEDNNAGYSVRVSVGDNEQGYGTARAARDEVPRSAKVLSEIVDEHLDLSTKIAVSTYLVHVSNNSVYEDRPFDNFSEEDVAVFTGSEPKKISINGSLGEDLKRFTGDVCGKRFVREVEATIGTESGVQRFVDSDGRMIREHNRLGKIYLTGRFRHKSGQELSHLESLTFLDEVNNGELGAVMDDFRLVVDELRGAVTPVSGQYPVIFSAGAVGTMIHEALGGHLLSGRYIRDGISTTFKDRLDTLVLPEFMTVVDNPRLKGASGFYLFDDEGIASKETLLIENGVLRNYLLDRRSAEYFGMKSNGHSRMEWVTSGFGGLIVPEPRVSNLDIRSSDPVSEGELEELAKKHCVDSRSECVIYIDSHVGQVDVQTSEFILYPSKAYKIYPNGKREPAHNFMVIANAYELLSQIVATSDNYEITHGVCGSTSGGIPTQEISPSAFLPRVNIQAIDIIKYKKGLLED